MIPDPEIIEIASRDLWFKVVDMLQQNWALIEPAPGGGAVVWFVSDNSGVFDELRFGSELAAAEGLERNGFRRLALDAEAQEILDPPEPPYTRRPHLIDPIYSSGRYWKA